MVKKYYHYENVYWWDEEKDAQDYETIKTECVSMEDYAALLELCDELAKAHTRMLEGPFLCDRDKQVCCDAIAKYDAFKEQER